VFSAFSGLWIDVFSAVLSSSVRKYAGLVRLMEMSMLFSLGLYSDCFVRPLEHQKRSSYGGWSMDFRLLCRMKTWLAVARSLKTNDCLASWFMSFTGRRRSNKCRNVVIRVQCRPALPWVDRLEIILATGVFRRKPARSLLYLGPLARLRGCLA